MLSSLGYLGVMFLLFLFRAPVRALTLLRFIPP